jgi:lipopolysaccharide heptosyltransferase II
MKSLKNSHSILFGYNQKKLRRAALLDKVVSLVLRPFRRDKTSHPIVNPKKILVVQSHLIGDLVMATPMLRTLRKAYPDSQISLLANEFAADLLEGLTSIDRIITMKFPWSMYDHRLKNLINVLSVIRKLRKEKFDLAIDAQIDMRNVLLMFLIGAKTRLGYDITGGGIFLTDAPEFPDDKNNLLDARLSLLECLGIDCPDKSTELQIMQEAKEWVESYLAQNNLNENRLVAIHPGASVKEKLWQSEKFAEVVDYLANKGFEPVIIEGPNDSDTVNSIVSLCKTYPPIFKSNLKNVVAFISRCCLIICLDSAAIHLAAAVGTPVVAIYGPKWPELTRPSRDNMDSIGTESVIRKVDELLACKTE